MSNTERKKSKNIVPIILAIVAMGLYVVGQMGDLYCFYDVMNTKVPMAEIIYQIIWSIPYLLLIVHLILYRTRRIKSVFAIVFILELILLVYSMIRFYVFYGYDIYDYTDILRIAECVGCVAVVVITSLSITKKSIILVCTLCILGLINVIYFVRYLSYSSFEISSSYDLYIVFSYAGCILFYITSVVHIVLINRKKAVAVVDSSAIELEQMLVQIKRQYDEGIITEQEYWNRKNTIIAKL